MNLASKDVLKMIFIVALAVGRCSSAYGNEDPLMGENIMTKDMKVFDLLLTGKVLQGIPNSVLEGGTEIVETDVRALEKEMDAIRNVYGKARAEKRLDHLVICIQQKDEETEIVALIARFNPLTVPYEKWDQGAMSFERAEEVRTGICLDIMNDFRKKAGGNPKINAQDPIDDIFIHAGKPGDTDLELIVDDVCLIGRD